MVRAGEATAPRRTFECAFDGTFDVVGEREILDGAARRADEVMVVLGEILGELVAGELAVAEHAPDDTGLLEQREIAVRRALRESFAGGEELWDRDRSISRGQRGDDCPPIARVALVGRAEASRSGLMHVGAHSAPR